ncbi:MAG: hypothetical protein K2O45_01750 [Oscillospiraceae bacterium]|nr:hypothetical protein [Oscillospiraceae bacterium]
MAGNIYIQHGSIVYIHKSLQKIIRQNMQNTAAFLFLFWQFSGFLHFRLDIYTFLAKIY